MTAPQWNREPLPRFQGLHPDRPLTVYYRHLPHWRQDGATYFVTFRLNDSLPQSRLRELEAWRRDWEGRHPPPRDGEAWEELGRETMRRVEAWLDQGTGSCLLKEPRCAECLVSAMHYFDGERYELDAYVVMPNHVHAVVRPLQPDGHSLERILQSWKRHTSQEVNRLLGLRGGRWQDESFDRIVRDEEHLYRCLQYISNNPT